MLVQIKKFTSYDYPYYVVSGGEGCGAKYLGSVIRDTRWGWSKALYQWQQCVWSSYGELFVKQYVVDGQCVFWNPNYPFGTFLFLSSNTHAAVIHCFLLAWTRAMISHDSSLLSPSLLTFFSVSPTFHFLLQHIPFPFLDTNLPFRIGHVLRWYWDAHSLRGWERHSWTQAPPLAAYPAQ